MDVNISVRGVDAQVFRNFKAAVALEGMNYGTAVTEALNLFLQKFKIAEKKKPLTSLKPFSWGSGNENISYQTDEILYGWKK